MKSVRITRKCVSEFDWLRKCFDDIFQLLPIWQFPCQHWRPHRIIASSIAAKHLSKTSIGPPKTKPTVQSSSYVIYYPRIRQCAPYIHRSPHCTKFMLLKLNYITCLSVWSKLHFLNINTLDGLVWNRLTMRAYRSKMAPWLPPRKGFAFPFYDVTAVSMHTIHAREREWGAAHRNKQHTHRRQYSIFERRHSPMCC